MKILIYILYFLINPGAWLYLLESLLCIVCDPVLGKYGALEDWLYKLAFRRLNNIIDRSEAPEQKPVLETGE